MTVRYKMESSHMFQNRGRSLLQGRSESERVRSQACHRNPGLA